MSGMLSECISYSIVVLNLRLCHVQTCAWLSDLLELYGRVPEPPILSMLSIERLRHNFCIMMYIQCIYFLNFHSFPFLYISRNIFGF